MGDYELLSIIVDGAGAAFVGISVLFLAQQIRLLRAAHADDHDWHRRIATSEALRTIREINVDALYTAFNYLERKDPVTLDEVKMAFSKDPALQPLLHKLLNFYEGLGNGVFLGVYDELTIKSNRRTAMEKTFMKFHPYIEYRRYCGSRTIWTGYERLIAKWHKEALEQVDRKPTGMI